MYIYVTPRNLPPTADTIRYTTYDSVPHDVNVILATSDPNGDPLHITIVSNPNPTVTVTQTGNGAYTITGTTPGTYTITYQVCDTDQYAVHVLCDTSVIIATILPTGGPAVNHAPVANNDYATTTGTTPATVNVRGNDSDPDSNPLTTPVLTTPATTTDGHFTVNPDGTITFQPNAGLTPGIHYDTVTYQICDITTINPHPLCATAQLIVTTNVVDSPIVNRPPVAVDDHTTVGEDSASVINVKTNDSDPDGDALGTPSILTPTVNGTIVTVASNGNVTYVPNPGLHSTNGQPVDSFKYQVCDTLSAHNPKPLCDTAEVYIYVTPINLPPVANDIHLSTPENTPLGVNVASGAFDPNGDPLTYTYPNGTTTAQGGHITITGNGAVIYTPPVGFVGVDVFEYQVCDSSPYNVHVLCDTGLVIINVTNPADTLVNHPPVASNDYGVAAPGATINVNVVANDSDPDGNPIKVTGTSTITTALGGTVTIGPNNTINYTAPSTVPDSIVVDSFSYTLCDTNALHAIHVLCTSATVYITINQFDTNIIHINRPPVAADDFSTLCEEDYSIVNVLNNDIDPNGDVLTVTTIISGPSHGVAAVSSPDVVYIPAQYFYGQDSLEYKVCDSRNPALCDTAWVHYTVKLINHRPLAAEDTISTAMQTAVNIPVTLNDNEPDGDSTTLAIVTPPLHGTVTQSGNSYTYTPTVGYSGNDTFYYRICDVKNPTALYCDSFVQLCDVGLVSIHVLHHPPHIPPTYDTIPENTPIVTICPMVSDTDHNSVHVTSFPCGPYHGTVGFATDDSCLTYVPNHNFVGDDTICVVVCDNVNPALCDTNKVYIHVTPICIPPVAVTDTYTVYHLTPNVTLNVTANDTNNGTTPLVVSVITQPSLGIAVVSAGAIKYTPSGTTGADSFKYSICSVGPACTTCDTGLVYINVTGTQPTPPIAKNDTASVPQDSSICVHVTANDIPGSTGSIHISSACTPLHGTNTIAPNGYICYTPVHGYYGPDSFCYTICDNSVPALCSTAIVHITVTPNPHPPVAVNDTASTPQGTPVTICVAGNDSDPDGNLNVGSVSLITLPSPCGTVTNIAANGCITFTPCNTLGIDSFKYVICDSTPVALGGPLCDTATVFVHITPLNHPPHAPDTTVIVPQDSTITVCPMISDPDSGQIVTITSACASSHGTVVITGPGCVNYTPDPSFYGVDSFCYIACDNGNPSLCDTGIITVVVTHVPHCPIAVADYATGHDTVAVVISELSNDQHIGVIGVGYSVTILSGPDAGNTAVVNANGTITYTAAAGYNGVDHIVYKVTDSLDHCSDSALITIYVVDTCVGPVAANDLDSVCEGTTLSANVQANDYPGNSGFTTITITKNGQNGNAFVNSETSNIVYTPNNLFNGYDTVTYQICTPCPSGPKCSSALLVIDVLPTNHAPVAVDDTATMLEDHSDTINVVANDYDIDGDSLIVSISAQPANGTLTLYNNQLIYKPFANYCGTDSFGYRITGGSGTAHCPNQRPWDLGLVFVNVICVNDTPAIPDTLVHVPEDSIITICIPYTDPDQGQHHTATLLCNPSNGTLTSLPMASDTPMLVCMTYKPDTNFYGVDSFCVVICDDGNPSPVLCDTSFIKIIVDPRNEPPVVHNEYYTTPKGQAIGVNVSTGTFDPNGDPITYTYPAGNGPTHGTWTPDSHGNGTGVYTPTDPNCPVAGGTCLDSFTVVVCDNSPNPIHVLCDTAEVYITIYDTTGNNAINHAPVANNDYAVTDTVTPVLVYVKANDTDPNGDSLTVPTIITAPTHGTVTLVNGIPDYTPTGSFTAIFTLDSFQYAVCDTNAIHQPRPLCDTAWAYVVINKLDSPTLHQNLPPVAVDDYAQTHYGVTVTIPVLHNDSDPNGDPIHVTTVIMTPDSMPKEGTAVVNPDGTITYIPFTGPGRGPNAHHPDTFYYVICDTSIYLPHHLCDTARVIITVPNSVQAVNDTTLTGVHVPVVINVKGNDYDPELDSFYVVGTVINPIHGTATLDSTTGLYTYTPDGTTCSITGGIVDSFSYQIEDTLGALDTAWVYIKVKCCQVIANDDTFQMAQGDTLLAGILINDGLDPTIPHHITISRTPQNGTVTVVGDSVKYIPRRGFCGKDYFEYIVSDTCGTDTGNVSISISCDTIRTIAVNDYGYTPIDSSITLAILNNDTFSSCTPVVVSILDSTTHGTVTLNANNTVTYHPNTEYVGVDSFLYKICEACGTDTSCATAWGVINVDSVCRGPIANNDTSYHGYVCNDTVHVTINDVNAGGATVSIVGGPLFGTANVSGGDIIYQPDGNHPDTTDVIAYSLCSNICVGKCDTALLIIHMTGYPCNVHHPFINNDTVSLCRNTDTVIHVLANDYDLDGNAITITNVVQGSHGQVIVQGDSVILYHPNFNFEGVDTFAYQACDNGVPSLCNTAKVFIDVHRCPAPPIRVDTLILDTVIACSGSNTICIDSIYEGAGYTVHFAGFCDSADHGLVVLSTDTTTGNYGTLCFTYTPNCDTTNGGTGFVGNDTMCLIICSVGGDTACTTVHVVITVLPKAPIDTIWANNDIANTCEVPVVIHILNNDGFAPNPGTAQTGTSIHIISINAAAGLAPQNGTAVLNDTTITYTPDAGYTGVDSFRYVITDNGKPEQYDTATVYVYVCTLPKPIAVDDNQSCLDTTTYVNVPGIIHILANDTLFPANDTTVVIVTAPDHGKAVVNANFTVTYTPDSGFHGNDNLVYQLCETVGNQTKCDTASVCIDVIDTAVTCFFPNGFSPNGDGVNDVFSFPCNNKYPKASIKIYNRWGDEVYERAPYMNDWNGTNMQGATLPDGTYYFIYQYNDGSGKSEARFVVVHR